jgi:hypothetical protein
VNKEKLENAAVKANDMVLSMSFAIMDRGMPEASVKQARMLQPIFGGVRDVLSDAARNYWEPGTAPDDWESFDSSRAALNLADAILGVAADRTEGEAP